MPRPSQLPTWATDTNYTAGADVGTPTKIAIPSGFRSQGWERDMPALAQYENEWHFEVGQWVTWLDTVTAAASDNSQRYPLAALNTTKVQTMPPEAKDAGFVSSYNASTGELHWLDTSNTNETIVFPIEVPDGASWTFFTVEIKGSPTDPSLPTNLPRVRVYKKRIATGAVTQIASQTDTSGTLGAYQAYHAITADCLGEVIDKTLFRYYCEVRAAFGGATTSGLEIHMRYASIAVTSQDPAA